jgi:hypothetical protein
MDGSGFSISFLGRSLLWPCPQIEIEASGALGVRIENNEYLAFGNVSNKMSTDVGPRNGELP